MHSDFHFLLLLSNDNTHVACHPEQSRRQREGSRRWGNLRFLAALGMTHHSLLNRYLAT